MRPGPTADHNQEYLKLVRRPLVHVLSLQVSHHISLLGPELVSYEQLHVSSFFEAVIRMITYHIRGNYTLRSIKSLLVEIVTFIAVALFPLYVLILMDGASTGIDKH